MAAMDGAKVLARRLSLEPKLVFRGSSDQGRQPALPLVLGIEVVPLDRHGDDDIGPFEWTSSDCPAK
jgi:hypothetical protein